MEQPLANLARAQDELRNALSANLGELRSAHDGVAAAAANALRERRREREESRTALEREASERARLETKLTQCETALRETKAAIDRVFPVDAALLGCGAYGLPLAAHVVSRGCPRSTWAAACSSSSGSGGGAGPTPPRSRR